MLVNITIALAICSSVIGVALRDTKWEYTCDWVCLLMYVVAIVAMLSSLEPL